MYIFVVIDIFKVFGSTGDGQTILDVIEEYKKDDNFKKIGSTDEGTNDNNVKTDTGRSEGKLFFS